MNWSNRALVIAIEKWHSLSKIPKKKRYKKMSSLELIDEMKNVLQWIKKGNKEVLNTMV